MKYVFLLFITIQSCLMNGQKNENVVKKDTLIANMDLSKDSTVIPKFIHKRYEGNFAGQSAFIEFTVTQSDKPELGSGFVSSAYLNYSQVCGMSRYIELYKINEHIINSKINDKNKINLNINGSNEGIGFYMPYSDTNFICSNGFLDKRSSTFKGGIEAMGNEFIFEFHENRSISADNSLLPKFELALKLENNHTIDNYNIFQYTYYSSKVLSGIFAFKDSTRHLGRDSQGCNNYAYSYNTEKNKIIDIEKIFKSDFKVKLIPFLEENFTEIGLDKLQNGRFFVCKGGLVFVKIQAIDCYDKAYQGHQCFLPFDAIKNLKLIDEDYCKLMGIELGY